MEKLRKAGLVCFWAALVIELVIVIADKSAYINPYESMLFRLTFLLFCVKILSTEYSRREWICIVVIGLIAAVSYFINTRDETVRAVVLVAACKDVDLRKILKVILTITLSGSIILFVLSITGIYGAIAVTADFGREGIETRYCFGMGHPNAFHCMLLMIVTLVIYLYVQEMKLVHFGIIFLVNVAAYYFTDSNTAFIVLAAVILGIMILKYCRQLQESKAAYILGAVLFIAAVAISAYGAAVGNETDFMFKLDKLLNGRFEFSYMYENARLVNWNLFALPENQEYFDQGFIRLFYWYGIVVGTLYICANLYLIWQSYKKKDYSLLVIVVGYAVFSIMEAHLISVYLLRNYLLIWLGYYWYQPYVQKKLPEGYFWQLPQMIIKRS